MSYNLTAEIRFGFGGYKVGGEVSKHRNIQRHTVSDAKCILQFNLNNLFTLRQLSLEVILGQFEYKFFKLNSLSLSF